MRSLVFAFAVLAVAGATQASTTPASTPPRVADAPPMLVITIAADGTTLVGSRVVSGDAAILAALRGAVEHGITEAMIARDSSRPEREALHIADLCKQAGLKVRASHS